MSGGVCPTCGRGASRAWMLWLLAAVGVLLLLVLLALVAALWYFSPTPGGMIGTAEQVSPSPR